MGELYRALLLPESPMFSPAFLLLVLGLTVVSAALAWFALGKVAAPPIPQQPDRRGWDVLSVQHPVVGDLSGPVGQWQLRGTVDGLDAVVRVVELDQQRWTEARVRVPDLPADLSVKSRARGEKLRGALPVGHPVLDEVLLVQGDAAVFSEVAADEARLASWLELLAPDDGPVLIEGWLVRSIDGTDGEAAQALVEELAAGAGRL